MVKVTCQRTIPPFLRGKNILINWSIFRAPDILSIAEIVSRFRKLPLRHPKKGLSDPRPKRTVAARREMSFLNVRSFDF